MDDPALYLAIVFLTIRTRTPRHGRAFFARATPD
jgi:hypothetical protein